MFWLLDKRIWRFLPGIALVLWCSSDLNGQRKLEQNQQEELVQFSGIVRNLEHQPMPNVNIIILNTRRGTTTDQRGMFSFVVEPSDTILFSHIGFKGTIHVIPDSLAGHQYPADIFMVSDTFQLAEVRIYPWKTYQEFKEAFLALELPDDDQQRAIHNIALIKTQIKMNDFGPSSNINFREVMKQQYNELYTAGQYPYYTIFDPMRWAKFFESLKRGDFKQKED
ncbi:MAG: carboxypeptidase-like regulatory domain-containing protein [Bacteroidales bacterium]